MSLRAWALALLAALGTGFIAGRWSIPRGKAVPLVVGASKALPERDMSPKGEVRTVIVTRIVPGPPAPPPVPAPPDLGTQLETTDTHLPNLPQGGLLHASLFGKVDDGRLVIRTVQWMDGPGGRVALPDAQTTVAPTTFSLPAPPAPPRWGAMALAGLQDRRPVYGAAVQVWKGPMGLTMGQIGNVTFCGGGFRW